MEQTVDLPIPAKLVPVFAKKAFDIAVLLVVVVAQRLAHSQ